MWVGRNTSLSFEGFSCELHRPASVSDLVVILGKFFNLILYLPVDRNDKPCPYLVHGVVAA